MDRTSPTSLDVAHDEDAARYELTSAGEQLGLIDYRQTGDVLDMVHTEILPAARGRGLGAVLVRGALDDVRARGHRIIPSCWFIREFVDANGDYADLLAT